MLDWEIALNSGLTPAGVATRDFLPGCSVCGQRAISRRFGAALSNGLTFSLGPLGSTARRTLGAHAEPASVHIFGTSSDAAPPTNVTRISHEKPRYLSRRSTRIPFFCSIGRPNTTSFCPSTSEAPHACSLLALCRYSHSNHHRSPLSASPVNMSQVVRQESVSLHLASHQALGSKQLTLTFNLQPLNTEPLSGKLTDAYITPNSSSSTATMNPPCLPVSSKSLLVAGAVPKAGP